MPRICDLSAHIALAAYTHEDRKVWVDVDRVLKDSLGEPRLMEQAISALLHEMVHAFLDIYGFRCKSCYKKPAWEGGCGQTGHGPPFLNSMCDLQNLLQDAVEWDVRCGIGRSVDLKMSKSRDWIPDPIHFAKWKAYLD
jgi:hypothetical protein